MLHRINTATHHQNMSPKHNIIVILVLFLIKLVNSANILGVFPLAGVSHHILASRLMKGLAEAGHDVTMISPYALKELPKNGTYTDIVLDGFKEDFEAFLTKTSFFDIHSASIVDKIKIFTNNMLQGVNKTFHHPKVKRLLESNAKFNLVIMEQFNNDALKVFAHIYNCPLITLSPMGPNSLINPTVGNPQPVSYVPHLFVGTFSPESILGRAKNLLFHILDYFFAKFYRMPKHNEIVQRAFPGAPSIDDLYTNVSLILLNSHTSLYQAVPVVPNMIEVGGFFIDTPKKLPKDLQEFLDNAKDGVIYFSMGSNLKSKDITEDKKKMFLKVFKNLKLKVLWKFEEDLPGKPSNVLIRKWLPQQDILAHPNIKLFITHGGLLSTTETIYHGVPILAIPVFGDQLANADRAVAAGYGLQLRYDDPEFCEEKLSYLVQTLLENPKYKENAMKRSKIFHDRPRKPMETAVFWVEYVLKHNGAPHLRVAGVGMAWYQYFMVDVLLILLFSFVTFLYCLKMICKKMCGKNKKDKKKLKKN